jgi:acyl-CoA synthetase (AMP-forming)/AMP-acid ligase II
MQVHYSFQECLRVASDMMAVSVATWFMSMFIFSNQAVRGWPSISWEGVSGSKSILGWTLFWELLWETTVRDEDIVFAWLCLYHDSGGSVAFMMHLFDGLMFSISQNIHKGQISSWCEESSEFDSKWVPVHISDIANVWKKLKLRRNVIPCNFWCACWDSRHEDSWKLSGESPIAISR